MKRIALIAALAGIALVVNAQEQGKEVKPSPTTSPEKPASASIQPGTTTEAPKKTEKPYGCYKDLRWGMTLEQAQTALGMKLKKGPFAYMGISSALAIVNIGDRAYHLLLQFDSSGLIKVQINPKEIMNWGAFGPAAHNAEILISSFNRLRPALEEKFGKPIKESTQDRGSDVVMANNLIEHKAILFAVWQTDESIITLTAEGVPERMPSGTLTTNFSPLLVYEKKAAGSTPGSKPEL